MMKTRTTHRFAAGLAALLVAALPAFADTGIMTADTSVGSVLTDAKGMTLYIFDKDVGGVSAC